MRRCLSVQFVEKLHRLASSYIKNMRCNSCCLKGANILMKIFYSCCVYPVTTSGGHRWDFIAQCLSWAAGRGITYDMVKLSREVFQGICSHFHACIIAGDNWKEQQIWAERTMSGFILETQCAWILTSNRPNSFINKSAKGSMKKVLK